MAHWRQVWSNNPQEHFNEEISRESDAVGIFPDEAAVRFVIGAVLAEQQDERQVAIRYLPALTVHVGDHQAIGGFDDACPQGPGWSISDGDARTRRSGTRPLSQVELLATQQEVKQRRLRNCVPEKHHTLLRRRKVTEASYSGLASPFIAWSMRRSDSLRKATFPRLS